MNDISPEGISGARIITVNIPEFPITLYSSTEPKITIDINEKAILFNTAINTTTPEGIAHLILL